MIKRGTAFSEEVLNSLQDLLFVFDEGYRLVLWNKTINDITGYSDEELSSMALDDLCLETELIRVEQVRDEIRINGRGSTELTVVTKEGTRIPFHFTCTPFRNRENVTIGIACVGRDRQSESTLQKRDAYYRRLFNGMLNGFCLCEIISDREGQPIDARFIDMNPAFVRMTGLEGNRILNRTAGEVLPGFETFWTSMFSSVESTDQPVHSVYYFKEKEKYYETTSFSPDTDQLITIFTDITESWKVREENKALQSQLFQAQKMEDVGRLAGGIAHDFNNLLTAIHGYTDLAIMQKDNEEKLKASLEQISLATQRAAQLAQQLLFFSKHEPEMRAPCNLNDIIMNLHCMLKRIIGEHISIELDLDPSIWVTQVNQNQIDQVLMNLCINARDAMNSGGVLTISTRNTRIEEEKLKSFPSGRSGRFVCISVADNGFGMNRETMSHIFKPFFTTKEKGQGTGLGLSVVNGIVKEHQGWINVFSEENRGTTFKIYLPVSVEEADSPNDQKLHREEIGGRGEKILFIEEDASLRTDMESHLGENGYRVYTARNVREAVERCEEKHYEIDLLFTDAVLPDTKGRGLIDSLFGNNPELKIILTSGYAYGDNAMPALNGRNVRFINKPYSLQDALRAIRGILDA
jgi:PAS domain S-box-containing protein